MTRSHDKVAAEHLSRNAYLYIRQSTLRQVMENTESTQRQYALRQKAITLGWLNEQVVVIDSDLGESGASTDRAGFQRLVSDVGLGRAGIVIGLEVSRLARNSSDWHRLLEICALTQTLILDEDGLYDPSHFNDRLLLGLKGTMSEAELHVLRARLNGGRMNKARRGELNFLLPVGLTRDSQDRVILEPDQQVQQTLNLFFQTYERLGTATAVVKEFRNQDLLFPRKIQRGVRKGEILWGELEHSRALQVLHNPRYSGTYVYGRHRVDRSGSKKAPVALPIDEWEIVIPQAHPGYISWEQYQRNLKQLRECAQAHGKDRRQSPAGAGPALLQGLAVCGRCGQRMTLRYNTRDGRQVPTYVCQRQGIERAQPICQSIPGQTLDAEIGNLLLEMMTPLTLDVSLAVQQELQQRQEEVEQVRRQHLDRMQYQADVARQRYMEVDPRHRLVADTLETEWNQALRELAQAKEEHERQRVRDHLQLDDQTRQKVQELVRDFPRVWNDPQTSHQQRKRILRLLVEDVTLLKEKKTIQTHIRFRGGMTRSLEVSKPLNAGEARTTHPEIIHQIDTLLDQHTTAEIAHILNEQGKLSGEGKPFSNLIIRRLCRDYQLKSRYDRLREQGLLTVTELAEQLEVTPTTINTWRRNGLLRTHRYNGKEFLYDPPDETSPTKQQGRKFAERKQFPKVTLHQPHKVHHAT